MKKEWMLFLVMAMTVVAQVSAWADEDPKPQSIRIEASDFQFKTTPATLEVMRPTTLTLVNTGKYTHEFQGNLFHGSEARVEVDGVVVIGDEVQELILNPGKTVKVTFVPRTKGDFEFVCEAKDPESHLKKGMKGTIKVQ